MPQMSPLWWLLLFVTFSITLIMFTLINFFIAINMPQMSETNQQTTSTPTLTWKW
uniref:ATP synthase complex subunit 8 n=2 Tax=Phaneropterinae TaxID=117677 RepID=A0A1J0M4A4_9ORTH|nr:ATP synthase F0 subunit 8 [Phaneroptera gracilis]APD14865.1 ATP synthase F0 subunit 8 [Ducetia sp. NS-2016]ARN59023.1 ATP synthase F0 subunit 8 [Phaneroptera gracilis]